MIFKHLTPDHRSVIKMVGHALTLEDDVEDWCSLIAILEARLSSSERGCLAATTLAAADDDQFWPIIETAVPARLAGQPLPMFLDLDAEARWWADLASPGELRAWLVACFVRLSASEQAAFLEACRRDAA